MGELFLVRTLLIPHSSTLSLKKPQLTHRRERVIFRRGHENRQEHPDRPQSSCSPASHVRGTHRIGKDLYPAPAFNAVLRYAWKKDHLHNTKSRCGNQLQERG